MLRIILWKAGFEWAHLLRILWPRPQRQIYYFAFGANLSPDVLQQRRIKVYEAFDHVLENAGLRFSQPGFYRDHGYASADIASEQKVYGKMYLILQRDANRMDYFEGVPFLLAHDKVFSKVNGSDFFYYRARNAKPGLKPTREYLDYLLNAYGDMEVVPRPYIESMAATEVLDRFLPQNQTGDFVEDINRWPRWTHPALVCYEGICLSVVEWLWNRSLLHWLIKH